MNIFLIIVAVLAATALGVISNIVATILQPRVEKRKKLIFSLFFGTLGFVLTITIAQYYIDMPSEPISLEQAGIISRTSDEYRIRVSGFYNSYTLACKYPNSCVPFILLKTIGQDGYYPRVDLSDKLTGQKGDWSVEINVLIPPKQQSVAEAPSWCKDIPVFDPQKSFEIYVALAPRGNANKLGDCIPAHLGYHTDNEHIQALNLLSGGIQPSVRSNSRFWIIIGGMILVVALVLARWKVRRPKH